MNKGSKMARIINLKNWSVVNVPQLVLGLVSKIVQNMAQILLNSNAAFVAQLLNGFVGDLLTSVNRVIRSRLMGIMYREKRKMNCLNVRHLRTVR